MKNKGIIFDLDGVIVDTAKYHYLAWKEIAKKLGYQFDEKDNEELKGVSRVKSLDILLQKAGTNLEQNEKEKLLTEKNNQYLELVSNIDKQEMLPGIESLLDWLNQENIPFSLGSASKNAPYILEKLKIKDQFSAIVDGNDVTKAKPDPEVFLIAAKKMGLKPNECVVIEDSQAGIEAAKKAGMTAIGIGKDFKGADFIFENTAALNPKFIKTILQN